MPPLAFGCKFSSLTWLIPSCSPTKCWALSESGCWADPLVGKIKDKEKKITNEIKFFMSSRGLNFHAILIFLTISNLPTEWFSPGIDPRRLQFHIRVQGLRYILYSLQNKTAIS